MPIHERIVTDGITSRVETVISAPRTEEELREYRAAHIAFMETNAKLSTFDGLVEELEAACRREPPGSEDKRSDPTYGSRFWYAREILMAIDLTRHWLKNGRPDFAASDAVRVGALAAEANATHVWPLVQLGKKNRQSTQVAACVAGKAHAMKARELDQPIRQMIDRYKSSDERITIRKLAKDLEKNTRTIQRHLKKMGITIPAF